MRPVSRRDRALGRDDGSRAACGDGGVAGTHESGRAETGGGIAAMKALFALLAFAALSSGASAQVTAYQSAGNLEVTHKLGCIAMAEMKTEYTPPDLMRALHICAKAKRYDDAYMLFTVAGVYSRFDALRVPDDSAHDAFQVLMANDPIDEDDQPIFQKLLEAYTTPGSPEFLRKCAAIKKLGPPTYEPVYMIRHGMGAFLGAGEGTPKDFDRHVAWKTAVGGYLHCNTDDL
jgi:hypothetical protein